MIRYLLDTNICIYLIKKHPPEVLANFQKIISTDQCQGIPLRQTSCRLKF